MWVLLWFFYFQYYESTDDAYVNGNMVEINSVVEGSVIFYAAEDTDLVVEGQILVQLDPTNYRILYEKELSGLGATVLEVKQMYDRIKVNRATVGRQQASVDKARYDFENRQHLVDSRAVSNEDFVHSQEDYRIAKSTLEQAEYELELSLNAVGPYTVLNHPLVEKQKAAVRDAYHRLRHCSIYAPCTGFVAQRSVQIGQSVRPNSPLMSLIPAGNVPGLPVWVDANFKETQLKYMRIGQPAEVSLDIYGSRVLYKGRVLGIASGTGSVFSLIPPQNATGNWIKIVQRLPVRIYLDSKVLKDYPARLGLTAYVTVDLTRQDLPMLAPASSSAPATTTPVFDISMQDVDEAIDLIIAEALNKAEP